ncbi:hypothetical protein RRG08_023732 [Elysia crispata]|uniref:Tyrosine-protein kinase ephrin type A/B receptor-like domain-containing protein n=1 Tax=Elysia crispata TaxID=231223 RepID=A0AAE0ZVG0_9GAST|nr:hypothetical protein RRG08_023732 [Elysia crispata]
MKSRKDRHLDRELVHELREILFISALVASLVLANLPSATAYVDLRGSSCANEELLRSIPKELVTWSGVIQLEMKCLDGYDPPLNMPDYKIFQCKPDGSAWDPPIFPDCTNKLYPRTVYALFSATVDPGACADFTIGGRNRRSVKLTSSNGTREILHCPSGPAFDFCKVLEAKVVCNLHRNKELDSVQNLGLKKPHIFVKINFPFNADTARAALNTTLEKVRYDFKAKLEQLTGWTSDAFSRLHGTCPNGTVMVINERDHLACRGCSLGHYLDMNLKRCELCAPGYYNDYPLQVSCKLCPAMRGVSNSTVWNIVKSKARNGSYAMVLCPTLTKDRNGNFLVETGPAQPPNYYERRAHIDYYAGKSTPE